MQWADRIGRRIKLRDLHILMTVVERGSMAKAAEQLAISQPVVSKSVADLEHALGVRLLDRSPQGVEPTIYGRAVVGSGVAVFDDLRQGVKQIEFLADPTAGEVRIGSTGVMSAGLLPAVIDRLSRQFPRLVFNVMQAPMIELQYRDLRERSVDLILGRMVTPIADEDLDAEILFDDPIFVVAGRSSKWVRRRSIDPAELVNEAWCLPPYDTLIGSLAAEAFRARGLDIPRHTVITGSIQLFNALLANGRFLGVLSGSTLRLSGKRMSLRALPVEFSIASSPVGIVTLKDRTVSPVVQLFIDHARKIAKPLAKGPVNRLVIGANQASLRSQVL
jgi:DNA-binding transcriptional LysR family regulator